MSILNAGVIFAKKLSLIEILSVLLCGSVLTLAILKFKIKKLEERIRVLHIPKNPERVALVTPEAKKLIGPALSFARERLTEEGMLFPFAYVLNQEGEIKHLLRIPEFGTANDSPEEVMEHIEFGLKEGIEEGQYKAIAVVSSAHALQFSEEPRKEAIQQTRCLQIQFEHESGIALALSFPYRWIEPGRVKYGQAIFRKGERKYFLEGSEEE